MVDAAEPVLADEVNRLVMELSGRVAQNFAAQVGDLGLSPTAAKVLLALRPQESVPMRSIARRLGVDPSNFTGVVDRLEDRGLVARVADGRDRRVKGIEPTERGLRLAERIAERLGEHAGPVGALSAAQLRQLRTLLRRILREP